MENLYPTIRNTVRAVIVRDGCVLLQKKQDEQQGTRYTLPGGAQETGETMEAALQRECLEEISSNVQPEKIIHIRDYFKHKQLPEPHIRHQLEILFQCRVPDTYIPQNGSKPDKHQIGVEWIAIDELVHHPLSPEFLRDILPELANHIATADPGNNS